MSDLNQLALDLPTLSLLLYLSYVSFPVASRSTCSKLIPRYQFPLPLCEATGTNISRHDAAALQYIWNELNMSSESP